MDVNLRRIQPGMPEPFPQDVGADAPLGLVDGKSVPQGVRADLLGDPEAFRYLASIFRTPRPESGSR